MSWFKKRPKCKNLVSIAQCGKRRDRAKRTFALTADVSEAHCQIPIGPRDWHLLGCQVQAGSEVRINTVGTFGFASASYCWSRVAAAHRLPPRGISQASSHRVLRVVRDSRSPPVLGKGGTGHRVAPTPRPWARYLGTPRRVAHTMDLGHRESSYGKPQAIRRRHRQGDVCCRASTSAPFRSMSLHIRGSVRVVPTCVKFFLNYLLARSRSVATTLMQWRWRPGPRLLVSMPKPDSRALDLEADVPLWTARWVQFPWLSLWFSMDLRSLRRLELGIPRSLISHRLSSPRHRHSLWSLDSKLLSSDRPQPHGTGVQSMPMWTDNRGKRPSTSLCLPSSQPQRYQWNLRATWNACRPKRLLSGLRETPKELLIGSITTTNVYWQPTRYTRTFWRKHLKWRERQSMTRREKWGCGCSARTSAQEQAAEARRKDALHRPWWELSESQKKKSCQPWAWSSNSSPEG